MHRIQNHIANGQSHILDPKVDAGVWLEAKRKGNLATITQQRTQQPTQQPTQQLTQQPVKSKLISMSSFFPFRFLVLKLVCVKNRFSSFCLPRRKSLFLSQVGVTSLDMIFHPASAKDKCTITW